MNLLLIAALLLPPADPLPIRRVNGQPPAHATLRALDAARFEELVRTAAQAANAPTPRILAARYAATLAGSDLTGTGTWQIRGGPGVLPLAPLTIALTEANGPGIALDHVQGTTRLLLNAPCDEALNFQWSARGREEPGAIRYDLQLPAAGLATLELNLPEGHVPSLAAALVTGPLPSPTPQHARWRFAVGSATRLELVVSLAAAAPSGVRANRSAKVDLATGQATFDFELEALRGPANQWVFRVDDGLQVLDAIVPPRATWRHDAARHEVIVMLADPLAAGRVSILSAGSGSVRAVGPLGEDTIEYRIPAEITLESWEPGDYTLQRTTALPDRAYSLTFRGAPRTGIAIRKAPRLVTRPASMQLNLSANLQWRPGETRNRLTARLRAAVLHGPVTLLALKLPAGYAPGAVRLVPDDPGAVVTFNGTIWLLEPSRPWPTGQTVDLRLELRGPPVKLEGGRAIVPVPQIAMPSGAPIETTLALDATDDLRAVDAGNLERLHVTLERIPQVVVETASKPAAPTAEWALHGVGVSATLDDVGRVVAVLSGVVERAAAHQLPIVLVPGAVIERATVNGKWVQPSRRDDAVLLPLPGDGAAFELQFRVEPVKGWVGSLPEIRPRILNETVDNVKWSSTGPYSAFAKSSLLVHRAAVVVASFAALGLLVVLLKLLRRRLLPVAALVFIAPVFAVDAPPPMTVYFHESTAYAPRELLTALATLAAANRPAMTFTNAMIRGREEGAQAHFTITLSLQVFRDGPETVALPVRGLMLESATLNGAPAFPVAQGERLELVVQGRQPQTIVLTGRVPIVARGADREAVLMLDPLPMAKLYFTAEPASRSLSVPSRQGQLQANVTTLEADLGSSGPVVLRWRRGATEKPARVSAVSATHWDLPGESVTATFAIRVEDGSLTRLSFDAPAALEPARITVRSANGTIISIRDWTRDQRTITVRLQEPLEGAGTITLRLVPMAPFPLNPHLGAVRLLSATAPTMDSISVRTERSPLRWERVGALPIALDALPPELNLPEATAAFRIEALGVSVRPITARAAWPSPMAEEILWRFAAKATVDGHVRFARESPVYAAEFDVPPGVVLATVQAAEVAGWFRIGNRVRVWFRGPLREAAITWTGSWPAYKPGTALDVPQPPRSAASRRLRLNAGEGFTLQVQPGRGWQPTLTFRPFEKAFEAPTVPTPLNVTVNPQEPLRR